jgi:hypothetical protein
MKSIDGVIRHEVGQQQETRLVACMVRASSTTQKRRVEKGFDITNAFLVA